MPQFPQIPLLGSGQADVGRLGRPSHKRAAAATLHAGKMRAGSGRQLMAMAAALGAGAWGKEWLGLAIDGRCWHTQLLLVLTFLYSLV